MICPPLIDSAHECDLYKQGFLPATSVNDGLDHELESEIFIKKYQLVSSQALPSTSQVIFLMKIYYWGCNNLTKYRALVPKIQTKGFSDICISERNIES